jgi:alpha-1,2-mannosyltransferase
LPAVIATAVIGYRRRNVALGVVSVLGVVLMICMPYVLLPSHRETASSAWRQLVGGPYLWWALAVISVAGWVAGPMRQRAEQTADVTVGATAPVPATS